MSKSYDFSGYASRYNVLCSDGRTIRDGAFKDMDGQEVTLTWGHDHSTPVTVLGKAIIEHREDGPYIYASFNDTEEAQHAKEAVRHGDIKYLSIFANKLQQQAGNVMHGVIREVSLVYGGANPGAFIDHATLSHGDGTYDEVDNEALIFMDGTIDELEHSDKKESEDVEEKEKDKEKDKEKEKEKDKDERTVEDVINEMTEEQLDVLSFLIDKAVEEANAESKDNSKENDSVKHSYEGDENMSYNAFENHDTRSTVITHADQGEILKMAKDNRCGTWKNAMKIYMDENDILQHDDDGNPSVETSMVAAGFDNVTALYPTMSNNPADAAYTSFTAMLPEFKDVRGGMPPELITYDNSWVSTVMNGVHKLPFSRIRTSQIDIRDAEKREALRAKGYQKGHKKKNTGNIKMARRTTDPQTVYVKNELHRDDIIDMVDFDYVRYLYGIDEMMLKEELATAILFGDSRDDADEDKIFPEHIRPIWTDDELYTRHIELDVEAARQELQGTETGSYFGDSYVYAEAMIETLLNAREDHLGTGTPDLFITQAMLNKMLLARDRNGRRIYSNQAELATALNVGRIITAKQFENRVRTDGDNQQWKMVAMLVNLADYSVGHTKGGEVTHFTQFDIDFNKQKSLIETRLSGALTRIQSAMVIEEKYEASNP
jgi:HK97 family phage prohead protease